MPGKQTAWRRLSHVFARDVIYMKMSTAKNYRQ
jgi:hypothetical protein